MVIAYTPGHWGWTNGCHRYRHVYFILWSACSDWQWVRANSDSNFTSKEMISIFSLSTFSSNIPPEYLHMKHIPPSWYEIPELVMPIRISAIGCCCLQGSHWTKSSLPVFSGVRVTRSLVLYVCFVDRCLFFCTFSFGHCVVCSPSIDGFWLTLWYLQTLLNERLHHRLTTNIYLATNMTYGQICLVRLALLNLVDCCLSIWLFMLSIAWSVLCSTASDSHCGIFKLFWKYDIIEYLISNCSKFKYIGSTTCM